MPVTHRKEGATGIRGSASQRLWDTNRIIPPSSSCTCAAGRTRDISVSDSARFRAASDQRVPGFGLVQSHLIEGIDQLRATAGDQLTGDDRLNLEFRTLDARRAQRHQRANDENFDGLHAQLTEVATDAAAGVTIPTSIDKKAAMPLTPF